MTLAEVTTKNFGTYQKSIDCATHGHVQDAVNDHQAEFIAHIHNKAMHPRALNRKLTKKR